MICPNCGNELDQNEVFCGQCGAQTLPSFKPTEMVQTPQAQAPSGLLMGGYSTQPMTGASYVPGAQSNRPPNAPSSMPSGPQQQGGFYQDATESISALPPMQNYPAPYPGTPVQGDYPPSSAQYGQTMQTGNYSGQQYPAAYPSSAGYGPRPGPTPPPRQRGSAVLVIAIICLGLAIISFGAFGVLYVLHKNQPIAQTTPTPAITATTVPGPTPSPTPSPSPTMTPSPTPTVSPTPSVPPADPGFAYCTDPCAARGFVTEFPQGWLQSSPDTATVIFNSPTQNDVLATFRTPGPSTDTADVLVTNDLNAHYATQPGYVVTTTFANRTIGGVSWTYEVATFQNSGVTEQVYVYATISSNNAYIIELQAPQQQYQTVDTSYFEYMLNRFQFQS